MRTLRREQRRRALLERRFGALEFGANREDRALGGAPYRL
jgi:hypothetical protein